MTLPRLLTLDDEDRVVVTGDPAGVLAEFLAAAALREVPPGTTRILGSNHLVAYRVRERTDLPAGAREDPTYDDYVVREWWVVARFGPGTRPAELVIPGEELWRLLSDARALLQPVEEPFPVGAPIDLPGEMPPALPAATGPQVAGPAWIAEGKPRDCGSLRRAAAPTG